MSERTFSIHDQVTFAQLSGDYNPLHVDPTSDRMEVFGKPVVHGIHSVLWAIESRLRNTASLFNIRSLHARFLKPLFLDEPVCLSFTDATAGETQIRILHRAAVAATVRLEYDDSKLAYELSPVEPPIEQAAPRYLAREEIPYASGELELYLNSQLAIMNFPSIMELVPRIQLAAILASTRVVGMECPGLHSVFSELSLNRSVVNAQLSFVYRVLSFDPRFGLARMSVGAPSFRGTLEALQR